MEDSFDLRTALQIARHRGWLVLLAIAVALPAAWAVTRLVEPRYEATAALFVGAKLSSGELSLDLASASLAQNLVASYAELARTSAVAAAAAPEAGIPSEEIARRIETEAQPGLNLLRLRAHASSPTVAARIANAVAQALAAEIGTLNGSGPVRIRADVVDVAGPPAEPAWPSLGLNLLLGGLAGLLCGIGLAFAAERFDRRIRSVEQAERDLGVPVVGVVPELPQHTLQGEALDRHAHEEVAEPYRSLALTLANGGTRDDRAKRILVTSPCANEGKTSVATHLALALAEENRATALVEGDLRRPVLRRHFPSESAPSLEDLLAKPPAARLPAATAACRGLRVVAARSGHADAGQILRSRPFAQTLKAAANGQRHVVVDAPPALGTSDAAVLASHVDAALVVVRAGVTRTRDARALDTALERLGVRPAGVVLVGAPRSRRVYAGNTNGSE